ncbi:unnamed protein product [Acanthoscelides obtectus]|uniref:Uncharacterized protein n=1 Tax=Acanthoscelides obtectus TaxID=200917 RepID=A0A9P0PSU4_ACAOB|nr:unnamed protein product [Acanthoscelides obtectus]CAK1667131.1 hypothetical protein AOBTE_LOCUS25695 [Acanthoscelides obtectus]
MAPKKLGRGRVLHSQSCEIVNNIIKFMKKEAEEGISIPLTNYSDRVLAATGVSKNTYQRICKESKKKDLQGPSSSEESEEGWDDDEAASEDELGCSILKSDSSEQNDDVM